MIALLLAARVTAAQPEGWPDVPDCPEGDHTIQILHVIHPDRAPREPAADIAPVVRAVDDLLARDSDGRRAWRWAIDEDCTPSVAAMPYDPDSAPVALQISARHSDQDIPVAAFLDGSSTDFGEAPNLCGRANGHIALVWCWRASTLAHELLHTQGVVPEGAPGGDGNHSTVQGDLMTAAVSGVCVRTGTYNVIDCAGDAYFAVSPQPGGYLAGNPKHNAASSPVLTVLAADGGPAQVGFQGVTRVAGPTRVETAVAVSQRRFPGGADVVYLVNGDAPADALAVGGWSADGPILFATRDTLPAATAAEIRRLAPQEIIAVGGTAVLSAPVLDTAEAAARP